MDRLESIKKENILSDKNIDWLIAVAEAAQMIVIKITDGIDIGAYRHLGNGEVAVDGKRWKNLNDLLNSID